MSKKNHVSREKLESMLFELCELVTPSEVSCVPDLGDWYGRKVCEVAVKQANLKKRALSKLTKQEREALGFSDYYDADEDC